MKTLTAMLGGAVVVAGVLAGASSADAQAARDWDIHRDAGAKTIMAFTQFDSGLVIGFRCIDGAFGSLVSGLPASTSERRTLGIKLGDGPSRSTGWTSTTNASTAVGDLPAPLARQFRTGGQLDILIAGGAANGADLVHRVDLPVSNAAIDEVLTQCGRPLVDPRDALIEEVRNDGSPGGGVNWSRPPRPRYPSTNYASGFVVTTCLTAADGRLTDCLNEMEHPPASRFGQAVLRATADARVRNVDGSDGPVPLRRIAFRSRFAMR